MVKLKKLYVKQYKNLHEFCLDFESGNGLTILIGNNGSGKSNILEAISAIFANAYTGKPLHQFVYSLTYEINGKIVKLSRPYERCQYYIKNPDQADCYFEVISVKDLAARGYLPSNVIALYSGEDKRWWHEYYEPFHQKYIRKLSANDAYTPKLPMYYINKQYWNIALLTLIFSRAPDDKDFLKEKIGIEAVDHILLFYRQLVTQGCTKPLLKAFLDTVNRLSGHETTPEGNVVFLYGMTAQNIGDTYGIQTLKHYASISDFYTFADAKFLADPPDEGFPYVEKEVFDFLVQACMSQNDKIIKGIEIICNGYSSRHLSEGEKKLILIRAALSFIADENSLILFDEPDANVHESRKQDLYQLFSEFAEVWRQMIVVTHSPTIAQLARSEELVMLEAVDGKANVISEEKIDKIKRISGTSWDVIGQAVMLNANKPLVVFEGKTDIMYTKRAIELLRTSIEKYRKINVDFINASGAGNMASFITNLKEFVSDGRKIIVFFDHDDAGKDGAKSVSGLSKDDERIIHFNDIEIDNLTICFIPYKDGVVDGDFLIEDYFDWNTTIEPIFNDLIPDRKHPLKLLPNLAKRIKNELESRYLTFAADEFKGFYSLLDKILELTEE